MRGCSRKVRTPSSSSARSASSPSRSHTCRPQAVQLCSTRVAPRAVTSMEDITRRQQAWLVAVRVAEGEVMTSTLRYHVVTRHGPM